jgi:hypothetical protein
VKVLKDDLALKPHKLSDLNDKEFMVNTILHKTEAIPIKENKSAKIPKIKILNRLKLIKYSFESV